MRRETRSELRSVTWGGSRFTGSATSPTTSVPAGCAWTGAAVTAPSITASSSVQVPRLVIVGLLWGVACGPAPRGHAGARGERTPRGNDAANARARAAARPSRPGVGRPGVVRAGPAILRGGQGGLLAGEPLERDRVDGDQVQPRVEAGRPRPAGIAVAGHQRIAERRLQRAILDHADAAERHHAPVLERGVALEA